MPATTTDPATVTPFPVPWAVKLIDRLHVLYGAKFLQQWEGVDKPALALAWAEELAGFTGEEIAKGLAACRSRAWPPTLPEFIGLCRPWLDPETAFREAVAGMAERNRGGIGTWSHPAVYWAAVRIGSHDLLSNGWQSMRSRWEAALRGVMAQGQWHPVPAPSPQLAAPGQTVATRAEAQEFMAQIRRRTGMDAQVGSAIADPKAWARKILANPGGRTPSVVDMARRAVEAKE